MNSSCRSENVFETVSYIVPPNCGMDDKNMRRHGFVGKDIDPKDVYANIKRLLQSEEFRILSEDVREGYWDLHTKKSTIKRIVTGSVRDVDVIVNGGKGKFEVQLRAGVWGMDLAIPAIEGVMTFGIASSAELHSAHEFEERFWEKIVHSIDPSLTICEQDGLLFKSEEELDEHLKIHEQEDKSKMEETRRLGVFWGVNQMGQAWV